MQFAHVMDDARRARALETVGAMIAPGYRHCAHTSGARHFNVERRITYHDCIFGPCTGLVQRLKYHSRMRLGRRRVGSLDRAEMPVPPQALQRRHYRMG